MFQLLDLSEEWLNSQSNVDELNKLLSQLTDRHKTYTGDKFKEFLRQNSFCARVAITQERVIIGLNCLKIDRVRMFTQNHIKAYMGDFVVDDKWRGKGVGSTLVKSLIQTACEKECAHINLTSNPSNPA